MIHKFTIDGTFYKNRTLPGLNEYLGECNRNRLAGGHMKKKYQAIITQFIRRDLKRLKINKPVSIHYHFYEVDRRRDKSNIASLAMKFIEDALQQCGVLQNDNWDCVAGFDYEFFIDKKEPRIVVELEEVGE